MGRLPYCHQFYGVVIKVRTAGVTVPICLNIGKLVFKMLNKMDLVFAVCLLTGFIINKLQADVYNMALFTIIASLPVAQTCWLLPSLDKFASPLSYKQPLLKQPAKGPIGRSKNY